MNDAKKIADSAETVSALADILDGIGCYETTRAAARLRRLDAAHQHAQGNVALLADILNRRPAMGHDFATYANWSSEVYTLMGAMACEPANDAATAQPAVAPQGAAYAPLTVAETRDLTCMLAGAPWPDEMLPELQRLLGIYDNLRINNQRPVDPATLPRKVAKVVMQTGVLPPTAQPAPAAKIPNTALADLHEGLAAKLHDGPARNLHLETAAALRASAAGAVAGPVLPAAWRRKIDNAAEAMSLIQASNNLGNLETTSSRALAGLRSIQSTYVLSAAPTPAAQGDADWVQMRSVLAMLMLGWGSNPNQTMEACYAVLDSVTEPGQPLAILRSAPDWRAALAQKEGGK